MNSYMIRTNLLVSTVAAIICVALQITFFQTVYVSTYQKTIGQIPAMTDEERFQFRVENTVAVTGLENAKRYFSSSEALLGLLKREVLPIFFSVLISLFAVDFWHGRRKTEQTRHL